MSSENEAEYKPDIKPTIGNKRKSTPSVNESPTKKAKGKASVVHSSGKVTGAWTNAEDKALFMALYPKQKGVGLDHVVPGRDAKSCQNRAVVLQKRLDAFFNT